MARNLGSRPELPVRVWRDVAGTTIALYKSRWKHIEDGHSRDIDTVEAYQNRIGRTLADPIRCFFAPPTAVSTESQGYVACNDSTKSRAPYFFVFVHDGRSPVTMGDSFVKSAYPMAKIPAAADDPTRQWHKLPERKRAENCQREFRGEIKTRITASEETRRREGR